MQAAIYARYSSENQRRESIDDQVASCRRLAVERGYVVSDENVFADRATSGEREDRKALTALRRAAQRKVFGVLLVDDLSRLARKNFLMLLLLEELRFDGIRVISVADGLDSDDREATIGIHVRGVFNELQLQDLSKKTFRGQMGQKARGFTVGEATFGYRSIPVGTFRADHKGRVRPDGYRMIIQPREAAVVQRVFQSFAGGLSESAIVRSLNLEGVEGRRLRTHGWSPATVHRMLRNEKYVGRWIWNRMETRRDPRTGRRRQLPKPSEKWVISKDESLRIVPEDLWVRVQQRLALLKKTWPGGPGQRGFSKQVSSRVAVYPAQLLSGGLICSSCGGSMVKVSGKKGGYYGCLAGAKRGCENRLLVRRDVAEDAICTALGEAFNEAAYLHELDARVDQLTEEADAAVPDRRRLKQAELDDEQCRVARLIKFVADGCQSAGVAEAIIAAERNIDRLRSEVNSLKTHGDTRAGLARRSTPMQRSSLRQLVERYPAQAAQLLRAAVGRIVLEPVSANPGNPYYRAVPAGKRTRIESGRTDDRVKGDFVRAAGQRVEFVVSAELREMIEARLKDMEVRASFVQTLAQMLWSETRTPGLNPGEAPAN